MDRHCGCRVLRGSAARNTMLAAGAAIMLIATLATPAYGQQNSCNGFTSAQAFGPNFGTVGSVYTVTLTLTSGPIDGGTQISIDKLRYELGCDATPFNFLGCNNAGFGDPVLSWVGDGTITTVDSDPGDGVSCSITWTSDKAPGDVGGQVVLTANTPIVMPPNSDGCAISFDVEIDSLPSGDSTPLAIESVGGFTDDEAFCDNDLTSANSQTLSFRTCPSCVEDDCNLGCDTNTGECIAAQPSTPCTDTDNNACTVAGCELESATGVGVCVQDHLGPPCVGDECTLECDPADGLCKAKADSTPCDDNDQNACTVSGCELDPAGTGRGVCVQDHLGPPCVGDECTLECDPADGLCKAKADSTPCDDNDQNACTVSGCELDPAGTGRGVCVQDHLGPPCVGDECTLECDPADGLCKAKADSTPCDDNDQNACTVSGCELDPAGTGRGVCVQDHLGPPCVGDECTLECDPADGLCKAKADSTPCDDNDQNACTVSGCELDPAGTGRGVCVQDHLGPPCVGDECTLECDPADGLCKAKADSTPCDDNDQNECTTAGCELDPAGTERGVCVQDHLGPPCVGDECTLECDPADGLCKAKEDSTPCEDTDGNVCTEAGCELDTSGSGRGVCVQSHLCLPDGKPACEISIGDFVWIDENGNGFQDVDEPGCVGATVELFDGAACSDALPTATTTTDGGGFYGFTVTAIDEATCTPTEVDLQIEVDVSTSGNCAGFEGTIKDAGGMIDDDVDSDCDPATGRTDCTPYEAGTIDLTVDCGFLTEGMFEICRTPGFWGTHAGTRGPRSRNITQAVIDASEGLTVCGQPIQNTLVDYQNSAVEGICVHPSGEPILQLARQMTAAALNCVISGGTQMDGNPCGGVSVEAAYDECDELCSSGGGVSVPNGYSYSDCIDLIDCFNNGGKWDDYLGCTIGTCSMTNELCRGNEDCYGDGNTCQRYADSCHQRELCPVDSNGDPILDDPLCFIPPGSAGSSKECNKARKNECTIVFGECANP